MPGICQALSRVHGTENLGGKIEYLASQNMVVINYQGNPIGASERKNDKNIQNVQTCGMTISASGARTIPGCWVRDMPERNVKICTARAQAEW